MTNHQTPTPITREEWRDAFLQKISSDYEAKDDLFELLRLIWDLSDSESGIPEICTLLHLWLTSTNGNPDRKTKVVLPLIGLISSIEQIRDTFPCFNNNSGYTKNYEKGVSYE
ncbi:hypothetical protein GCM10028808_60620 [Spirosoma migulaei]